MKTISQIVKMFDNGLIKRDKVYEIEVGDLVRIYKAHQRALSDKVALEARVASFEIIERKEKIIYGWYLNIQQMDYTRSKFMVDKDKEGLWLGILALIVFFISAFLHEYCGWCARCA